MTCAAQGITAHGGKWRVAEETGNMLYYYVFKDTGGDVYKVPCFTITAPLNKI